MSGWTAADIPAQAGRVAVVTGANSGLGLATARELARAGARVVMASRSAQRGATAEAHVKAAVPGADVVVESLDLASLASVREFAKNITTSYAAIDLLVNNAGVMAIPRAETVDGFEMQLGTNHLGHFALTGLLLPSMIGRAGSRVVTVSSTGHRVGTIDFADPMARKSYRKWGAYAQSKLANLLFAYELQRRLNAAGAMTISVAAHPGYASTNLQSVGPRETGNRVMGLLMSLGNAAFGQSADDGALPQLYAATAPQVQGGQFFGPSRLFESRGAPKLCVSSSRSQNLDDAARLWTLSEALTGIGYQL